MITQSLLPLSAAGAIRKELSEVITTFRNGVPVWLLTKYSNVNDVFPSVDYDYQSLIPVSNFKSPINYRYTRNSSHKKSSSGFHAFYPSGVLRPWNGYEFRRIFNQRQLSHVLLFLLEQHLFRDPVPYQYIARLCRDDISKMEEKSHLTDRSEHVYDISPITDFPSWVIQAWVTIAPKGLSANFEISLPVCKSQIPTQSLVTVTARLHSSAKLRTRKVIIDQNAIDEYRKIDKNQYLIISICNSCLSITWTCSKILFIFHTLTLLSILDVTTLFQLPIVNASNWMILAKWASSIFTSSVVSNFQTYKFFLRKTQLSLRFFVLFLFV